MSKSGRKPVAARALTASEKTIRQQNVKRIIRQELENVGCKSMIVSIPPVYILALQRYEAMFKPPENTDYVQDVIKLSGWICKAIEEFIETRAKLHPNSEMATLFKSDLWKPMNTVGYEDAEMFARIAIAEYITEQNERISNAHTSQTI